MRRRNAREIFIAASATFGGKRIVYGHILQLCIIAVLQPLSWRVKKAPNGILEWIFRISNFARTQSGESRVRISIFEKKCVTFRNVFYTFRNTIFETSPTPPSDFYKEGFSASCANDSNFRYTFERGRQNDKRTLSKKMTKDYVKSYGNSQ